MKRLLSLVLVCTFLLFSCGGKDNTVGGSVKIESISFCADGDVELDCTSASNSARGYVMISEADGRTVGEDDILFVSEDTNVASVRVLKISKTLIQYEITARSPGETYIFAQSSDGGAVSGKIRVVVVGAGSEPESVAPETEDVTTEHETEALPESEPESESSSVPSDDENTAAEDEADDEPTREESTTAAPPAAENGETYVINKNTKKIHKPSCSSVKQIKPENYGTTDDPESLLAQGYEWCKRCAG